jgi:predicted PilT family ATPase
MATDSKIARNQLRLVVHKSSVGPLIGKSGSVIQNINTKSGATIGIEETPQERRLADAIRERVMTIFFTDNKQLQSAVAELAPILRASREEALNEFKEPRAIPQDEQLFTALIHSAGVTALLQLEGAEIKSIQEETGASLRIRDRLPQSSEHPIQFKGTLEQVTKALLVTLPHLLSRPAEEYRRYLSSLPVNKDDKQIERTLSVPSDQVPFIVGREGRRAKEIKKRTSCFIVIPETTQNGDANRNVPKTELLVKGPSRNISIAVSMILGSKALAAKRAAGKFQ